MSEWQPIETAPVDGTRVIAWWPHLGYPTIGWWSIKSGVGWRAYTRSTSAPILLPMPPTHWMQFPEPPAT